MIHVDPVTIDAIKAFVEEKNAPSTLRVQVRTSGCCDPTLALIFDQSKPDDIVAESNGLTFVMDPATHNRTGDVSIELAENGDCPSFTLTPDRPLSEWSGFCVTTIAKD